MNNHQKKSQVLKSIATHSLVAAVFSQPWIMSFGSDLLALGSGNETASLREQMMTAMTVLSSVTLLISVVFFILYFLHKRI